MIDNLSSEMSSPIVGGEIHAQRDVETYLDIYESDAHPFVKRLRKGVHVVLWSIKLLIPDVLIDYPNFGHHFRIFRHQPEFRPLRAVMAAWVVFSFIAGSLLGGIMISATHAQAVCPGTCAGQATVGVRLATDGAGTIRHRARAQMLASGTVDPTTTSADTLFELKAGESVTVKSAVRIGGTGTPVGGTITLTVKFLEDNSTTVASSSVSLSRALGAGDISTTIQGGDLTFFATNNGLSSGTPKAGTYRIRIHMDYSGDAVNGTYTSDSDGNYSRTSGTIWQTGSAPDKFDKGYLRAGIDLTAIGVSQTLGGVAPSTFAWPDSVRVAASSSAQALSADATLGITYKTLNGATPVRSMTSTVSKSGTTAWDDDGTGMPLDTTDPTLFGVRIGDLAVSPLSDRPWTHFESAPAGWSLGANDGAGTKSVYVSKGGFAYDSAVTLSNLVNTDSDTSRVYNRGETAHGTISVTNARGSTFTPRGTETLTSIDTGGGGENNITFIKASSTLTWSSAFATSGNIAPATAAGSAKKLRWRDSASNSPTPADTAQYGALSSLLKISTAGSGSPTGAITTNYTVYNRGETATSTFYLYTVRDSLATSTSNLTVKITKPDYSTETSVASESSDASGLVSWSYLIGSSHQATADTTGSPKTMVIADANNNVATSSNTWGVSSLLTVDNIWHARFTTDASESSQFIIASDLLQLKNHVQDVRGGDKNAATVNSVSLDPSSNSTTLANGTTGSDGWSAFQQVTPSAPSGVWTLKSSAYDSNGNSAASTTETVTYTSPYTAKYGIRSIGWNQQYHKGNTATFVIQTLAKDANDDWTVTDVDSGTTPYYEIMQWTGSTWATTTARTNMSVQVASSTWTASYAIANSDTEIGKKYSVSFNARIGGAQMSQLQEFAVVQQTAGDPITVAASPVRATAGDTVKLTIRESNLDATVRAGNAAGTKVYIYDPDNTVQVNGSAPTEIGNGAYYYSYALGSSPTNGVWQVVITTDSNAYSAATNFEVNYQIARETSVNAGTSTLYTAITNASSSLGSTLSSVQTKTDTINWSDITTLNTNVTNASSSLANKIETASSSLGARIDAGTTSLQSMIANASSSLGSKIDTSVTALQGRILNQETYIKTGTVLTLMYRAPSGLTGANVPVINIYDPSLTQVLTSKAMSEIGTTGVYRATTTVSSSWGTGNFTVIASDPVYSTRDSMNLSVSATDLSTIDSAISAVGTDVDSILARVNLFQTPSTVVNQVNISEMHTIANDLKVVLKDFQKTTGLDEILAQTQKNLEQINQVRDDTKRLQEMDNALRELRAIGNSFKGSATRAPIIETFFTSGSIIFNMLITNPTGSGKKSVDVYEFLPKEARPTDIIKASEGLDFVYDPGQEAYAVVGKVTLSEGSSKKLFIEMEDRWQITAEEMVRVRTASQTYAAQLANTPFAAQALILKNDVALRLDDIQRKQTAAKKPEEKIVTYRENVKLLDIAQQDIDQLMSFASQAGESSNLKGFVGGIQAFSTWGIMVAILGGIGMLAYVLFKMWQYQMAFMALQIDQLRPRVQLAGIRSPSVLRRSVPVSDAVHGIHDRLFSRYVAHSRHFVSVYAGPLVITVLSVVIATIVYFALFANTVQYTRNRMVSMEYRHHIEHL